MRFGRWHGPTVIALQVGGRLKVLVFMILLISLFEIVDLTGWCLVELVRLALADMLSRWRHGD
jgi:hypothetical protein